MNKEQLQALKANLGELKKRSKKIRIQNVTKETTGGKYPIQLGYAKATRRPVEDVLRWMTGVEEMLEIMLEEDE